MQSAWIIIKKELRSYACSPLTFIFLTIFLAFQMGFTFILGRFYESNQASLDIFFSFQPWLYLFLIPAIGMRLWAEEKSSGTIETLATLPLGLPAIIAGKFLASWIFVLFALLLTFPIVITVFYLGSPDPGPIVTGYCVSWLMAGAFLAITCFTSALTRNQVISFVLAVIICFGFVLVGYGVFHEYLEFLPVSLRDFLAGLGFIPHFQQAIRGVIDLRDVIYFASIIVFFLILNAAVLESKNESYGGANSLLSATSILILCAALVCLNFIATKINLKLDSTRDRLYTLSEGSRAIANQIEDDAVLQFFFSSSAENLPVMLKDYGRRVQELLTEYAALSPRLRLEVYDPRPDSDEEEMAARYGIHAAQTPDGTTFIMGAALQFQDQTFAIPFFDPRKEMFLEYEIASLLTRTSETQSRKVLGLLSGVALKAQQFTQPLNTQQATPEDWLFVQELEKIFKTRELTVTLEEIPADIDLLLVLHPLKISSATEYAIEQYILRGGKVAIIVDPSARTVPDTSQTSAQYGRTQASRSNVATLFKTLGVQYDESLVVADPQYSTRVSSRSGPLQYPYWLSLTTDSFNREQIITSGLNTMLLIEPGFFTPMPGTAVEFTPLISTSASPGTINSSQLAMITPQNTDRYQAVDGPLALAALTTGRFKSAFSEKPPGSQYAGEHLTQATEENTVLLIGDIDFINNSYSLRQLNFLGQNISQPLNQNIAFLTNALEFMTGSTELISIRSRGTFQRPFERVAEIEKKAQAKWFNEEQKLTDKIQELQQKLNELQRARSQDNQLLISREQQAEIDTFKIEQLEFKRKLREVRKNLRQDIERLGTVLTIVNITVVPILVLLAGLYMYFRRANGKPLLGKRRCP